MPAVNTRFPVLNGTLPFSEEEARRRGAVAKLHARVVGSFKAETPEGTRTWIEQNIRPRRTRRYNELTNAQIKDISRRNYTTLRWFHGTPDGKSVDSILSTGLTKDHGDSRLISHNFVTKSYRFAKLFADGKKENVLRVLLNPTEAGLFNMYQEDNLKLGKTADDIPSGLVSTQDTETISPEADRLFHTEMSHDIPDISPEQSRACLRRQESFSQDWQEPQGWTPLNGTWRAYADEHDDG